MVPRMLASLILEEDFLITLLRGDIIIIDGSKEVLMGSGASSDKWQDNVM